MILSEISTIHKNVAYSKEIVNTFQVICMCVLIILKRRAFTKTEECTVLFVDVSNKP